ncbi:hypothetical protein B0H16DRAFT_1670779 [Mycena metata]|uniref:Uncharacterized protein n=1 Tax=Mycena metata TaxID=1033252 RepID=A0AAD7KF79_9AGAR|nr:hypothetical protein B0H16DRAFT_1670779 [Mycena metata]
MKGRLSGIDSDGVWYIKWILKTQCDLKTRIMCGYVWAFPYPMASSSAREIAQNIFDWERITEEHAAVLRQHPNQFAQAYEELEKAAPPNVNVIPPRDEWDKYIEEMSLALDCNAVDFTARVKTISQCSFLCQLSMMKAAEDPAVNIEMLKIRSTLHQNHYYPKVEARFPPPAEMHPYLAKLFGVVAPLQTSSSSPVLPTASIIAPLQQPLSSPPSSVLFTFLSVSTCFACYRLHLSFGQGSSFHAPHIRRSH